MERVMERVMNDSGNANNSGSGYKEEREREREIDVVEGGKEGREEMRRDGIWDMGYGIWDIGFEVQWGVRDWNEGWEGKM